MSCVLYNVLYGHMCIIIPKRVKATGISISNWVKKKIKKYSNNYPVTVHPSGVPMDVYLP